MKNFYKEIGKFKTSILWSEKISNENETTQIINNILHNHAQKVLLYSITIISTSLGSITKITTYHRPLHYLESKYIRSKIMKINNSEEAKTFIEEEMFDKMHSQLY